MKRLFLTLALLAGFLFSAEKSSAQVGIELGYANSVQRLKPSKGEAITTPRSGFYIELDYAVNLFAGLKIAPGIQYMYLAGEAKFPTLPPLDGGNKPSGDIAKAPSVSHDPSKPSPTRKPEAVEHYLSIPVDLSYTFRFGGSFGLTAFVTPTLNCGLKSDIKVANTATDMYKVMEDLLGKKDAYSRVDFLLGVGLAADFGRHFRIKFSYDFGLTDRAQVADFALHQNVLKVGIGLMF